MAVGLREVVINDDNWQQHVDVTIDGSFKARGAIPRPYETVPQGFYKGMKAFNIPLVPRDEIVERIKEQDAHKSSLIHLRRRSGPNGGHIPSLDQNGQGYCWFYSGTMANMLLRAKMGQPYKRLSAHAGACIIKKYRDEGGWGAQGVDWMLENGVPDVEHWPEKSMRRENDTPEMRANAKLYKMTAQWADLAAAQYDRNVTEDQSLTLLIQNTPVVADFGWWGHSVCLAALRLLKNNPNDPAFKTDFGSLDFNNMNDLKFFLSVVGKVGINSWTDQYGDLGEFTLSGTKAHLDGGCAPGGTTAS